MMAKMMVVVVEEDSHCKNYQQQVEVEVHHLVHIMELYDQVMAKGQ